MLLWEKNPFYKGAMGKLKWSSVFSREEIGPWKSSSYSYKVQSEPGLGETGPVNKICFAENRCDSRAEALNSVWKVLII